MQILRVGALAGLGAGLLALVIHQLTTVPMTEAVWEYARWTPPQIEVGIGAVPPPAPIPGEGRLGRMAAAAGTDLAVGLVLGVLLAGTFYVRKRPVTWRTGVYWGLAGFAAVVVAPAFGLPPDFPGTPTVDPPEFRVWWMLATALLTAAGLALVFLARGTIAGLVGVALIFAPHVWGGPPTLRPIQPVPGDALLQFQIASFAAGLVFWLALGIGTALLYRRTFPERAAGSGQ